MIKYNKKEYEYIIYISASDNALEKRDHTTETL